MHRTYVRNRKFLSLEILVVRDIQISTNNLARSTFVQDNNDDAMKLLTNFRTSRKWAIYVGMIKYGVCILEGSRKL